jgi:uncharacterized lipoprotein NlpE involved in copper resistance
MNKLLLVILMTLVGCNNQQKLEDCMDKAARRFEYSDSKLGSEAACAKEGLTRDSCDQANALNKQKRLEDEERCVKLYK